jgi:Uncharacterized protein conserved in bacteria C-term(DUF2220)
MAADLVWNRIGLERFSHPIHVKGCVFAEDREGILVHGRAVPFASFHPEMLHLLKLCGRPTALLTIENYASFNRYVREIDDGALVVYTGGFASVGVVELLKSLLTMADPAVPFFHWGDIDPWGLRIFRFLEEALSRRVSDVTTRRLKIGDQRPARGIELLQPKIQQITPQRLRNVPLTVGNVARIFVTRT